MEVPTYQCLAYRHQAPLWNYLDDVFGGRERWLGRDMSGKLSPTKQARVYLPQEPAESDSDYLNRITRSPYIKMYAQAIRKFVGLIFSNPLEFSGDENHPFRQHFANLDNRGTNGEQFLRQIATAAMKHGHTFVLIDYPPKDPEVRSHADFLASGRRPFWTHYNAPDVPHWETVVVNGKTVLASVTVREWTIGTNEQGEPIQTERFRTYYPGSWELWKLEKNKQTGKLERVALDAGEMSIKTYIPFVCIYSDASLKEGWYESRPPLESLADLNVTHYQVKSDHLRKVHLCCCPIPELKDSMRPDGETFVLGPTSLVHIRDPQGYFMWREPLATSIIESRREVQDLEAAADVLSAAYLSQPSDRQSAVATLTQVAEIESSLQGFVSSFQAGIDEAAAIHADYLKAEPVTIYLSSEVLNEKGTDSQLMMAYTNFATALKDLPPAIGLLLLQILQLNSFIPEKVDIESIAKSLETAQVTSV